MTICHAKQEDEKELVIKFGFIGAFCMAVGEGSPLPLCQKTLCYLHFYRFREGRPLPYKRWFTHR